MYCYRLSFHAPFHVDGRGNNFYDESETFIHSDTLSAAILSAWAQLEPENAVERAATPPYLLSSAFPYYRDIYLLPRPVGNTAPRLPEDRVREHKRLKKIQWLPVDLWRQAATGTNWVLNFDEVLIVQDVLALPRAMVSGLNQGFRLWAREERPRLSVDRTTVNPIEGQLFHFGRIYFHPDGGLYFLARFDNTKAQNDFEAALSLLGDSGLGADRTNGNGFFHWQRARDFPKLPDPGTSDAITLSLINPAPEDYSTDWLENAQYALISRGGWISGTGIRRKRLRLFTEGSQFRRPLLGRVVDVSPEEISLPHPVYRDGRGFFIGTGA